MRKILLNKRRSKTSINNTNIIPVEINRDYSIFHDEKLTETIDTLQVYNEEKNKSTKHRFIFTINPICTNVLFNNLTEIVYKEGSDDAKVIYNTSNFNGDNISELTNAVVSSKVNRIQAIRNTEYSNDIFNITYHCGSDIFNNHLLRKKDEITVLKMSRNASKIYKIDNTDYDSFNTIGDYCRNFNGDDIKSIMPDNTFDYIYKTGTTRTIPLYIHDTIETFPNSFNNNLKKENGWIGFYNVTTLQIPIKQINGNDYYVNKCINNIKSCQFVDMAPERDLFYFTPKKNHYRNRLEYNWDYCLTYPAECIYEDGVGILKGRRKGLPTLPFVEGEEFYDEKCNLFYQYDVNNNEILLFRCPVRHNLKENDTILIKLYNNNTELFTFKSRILSIGTPNKQYKERYFTIRKSDFNGNSGDTLTTINETNVDNIRFIKIINGYECEYYYRKFKKIDAHKSVLNKLAFSENIYGDEVSQITYTEDIDVDNYKDNLGRPLSEIYLTIIKSNRGNKEWYKDKTPEVEQVEYSHVFGEITSGLDLPIFVKNMANIRYQHNITKKGNENITIPISSDKLETNITLNRDNLNEEFYGDLIELNITSFEETILEEIKHRFNTVQREADIEEYNTIIYDDIDADIYDDISNNKIIIKEKEMDSGYANLNPEGYVYKPHHKIKINKFDTTVNQRTHIKLDIITGSTENNRTCFYSNVDYKLLPNDVLICENNDEITKYVITEIGVDDDNHYLFYVNDEVVFSDEKIFYQKNREAVDYAYTLTDKTGRCLWRNITPMSTIPFDDELYKVPFTNGAFYHHTNIIFPVKRQDPFKEYGMEIKGLKNNFNISSQQIDTTDNEYILENTKSSCY